MHDHRIRAPKGRNKERERKVCPKSLQHSGVLIGMKRSDIINAHAMQSSLRGLAYAYGDTKLILQVFIMHERKILRSISYC